MTWVWIGGSAEIVALDSFAVGDIVAWSCRVPKRLGLSLPADLSHADVLIEDSDYAYGVDDDFVEVTGRVTTIRVAHGSWAFDALVWSQVGATRDAARHGQGDPEPAVYLVEVADAQVA